MAKKFFTTDKTGEEVEVSQELAKQLIDAGKKAPGDFNIEEGETEEFVETPFDPANISFNQLPEGDTGISPVDIQGQPTSALQDTDVNEITAAFAPTSSRMKPADDLGLDLQPPTEVGGLPTLEATGQTVDQQSVDAGLAFVSDVFSLPERSLGALVNSDEDRTILQELGDPEASITKELKKKLRESGANGAVKFLGEMGLSLVSDPLFIGSLVKSGVKGVVSVAKAAKKPFIPAKTSVKVSKEVQDQVELLAPKEANVPTSIKEIDMTPGERQLIGGITDEATLAAEAVARQKAPGAVEKIQKAREGVFPARVESRIDASGVKDLAVGSETLTGRVVNSFDGAFNANKKAMEKTFEKVEKIGNSAPIDKVILQEAKQSVESLLPGRPFVERKFRKATELTDSEIANLVRKNEFNPRSVFDESGRPVNPRDAARLSTKPTISDADLEMAGISKPTLEKINNFSEIMREPALTYSQLKNARGAIKGVETQLAGRMRPADKFTLNNIRQHYTNLMGKHLKNTDKEAFDVWKNNDALFSQESKEGFKTLRDNFYTKEGNLKTGPEAFDSVIGSKKAAQKMAALKERLPPAAYEELQNAYFNRIIEGSFKNGILDSKKFLRSIEKFGKDPQLWDYILTPQANDVLADLIVDAVTFEKLAKFKTPKAVETALKSLMKGLGSQGIKYGIWRMFGGVQVAAFSIAQKTLAKGVAKTEARQAVDFFKGVDSPSFMKSFKQGVRTSRIDDAPIRFKGLQEIGKQATPARRAVIDASIDNEEIN